MSALTSGMFWGGTSLWLAGIFLHRDWARMWGAGFLVPAYAAQAAGAVARGNWWGAVLDVVFGAAWAFLWWSDWRKRTRRDPAAKTLGDKSRRLVAALVERAREAAKPRRVLRPVRGGAGA